MNDMLVTIESTEPKQTQAVVLAGRFLEENFELFAGAEKNEGVVHISIEQFDQWCVRAGLSEAMPTDYASGTIERNGLVQKRNYYRRMINSAAVFGKHGWPPYEIDVADGGYKIRLVEPFLRVVTQEIADRISGLIENKADFICKVGKEMANDERLPWDLRMRWTTNHRIFKIAANAAAFHIRQYIEEFQQDYTDSQQLIRGK